MKIAEKSIWKYTIVYYDNAWSRHCAERIRDAITRKVGVRLPMVTDSSDERECEIIVGKTSRPESVELRTRYDRPNIYYDIVLKGSKLICMGEGYRTLDRVASILEALIGGEGEVSLRKNIASGDLRADDDGNMIDRAEGTDVRVFDWNLNAPGNMGANLIENAERAADVILRHLPDVIGTNEMYNSRNCEPYKRFYDAVMRELSPYYTALESSPYDEGQPTEGLCGDSNRYGIPPENIIFRRELELYPVASGYRYTPNLITYHGYHWAIFKTEALFSRLGTMRRAATILPAPSLIWKRRNSRSKERALMSFYPRLLREICLLITAAKTADTPRLPMRDILMLSAKPRSTVTAILPVQPITGSASIIPDGRTASTL